VTCPPYSPCEAWQKNLPPLKPLRERQTARATLPPRQSAGYSGSDTATNRRPYRLIKALRIAQRSAHGSPDQSEAERTPNGIGIAGQLGDEKRRPTVPRLSREPSGDRNVDWERKARPIRAVIPPANRRRIAPPSPPPSGANRTALRDANGPRFGDRIGSENAANRLAIGARIEG
jgi:hypothetical protein